MHIYIDESGGFIPLGGSKSRVSAVVGLVIPSALDPVAGRTISKQLQQFRAGTMEVKGSDLNESDMREIAKLLKRFNVLIEAVIMDMGEHSDAEVSVFKKRQAATIAAALPENAAEEVKQEAQDLYNLTLQLSNQTFVQSYLTIALIDKVFRTATAYYSLRSPRELREFAWVVDAKDVGRTPAEMFWQELVLPALHVKSKTDPVGFVPLGDYSHFEAHLERVPDLDPMDRRINMSEVMRRLEFADSQDEPGLRAVDIAASAVTRAFNGTLGIDGWRPFGAHMVHRNRESDFPPAIQMVVLRAQPHQPDRIRKVGRHGWVYEQFGTQAKAMIPKR